MRIFAERLKELRKSKGYTKSKFARKLGMSKDTISKIELGRVNIRMHTLFKIVLHFNISSDYLLGRINEKKKWKD